MEAQQVQREMRAMGDETIAEHSSRFFKTGPGEYGEGDRFLGIRVPEVRKVAGRYRSLSLAEVEKLFHSPWHEERLAALLILVRQFEESKEVRRQAIYNFYMANTDRINNWDLVDVSAPKIAGAWLEDKPRDELYRLVRSESLWERRIAILATLHFIKNGELEDALDISARLLKDDHDLIHKAVGWMLREAGKQNRNVLEKFLKSHFREMPRTMLRYAIEKLPEARRQAYLKGSV